MTTELPQRLAAILAADIAGYTRLMEHDEAGVVAGWRRARAEVIDPTVARYQGRIVKLTGDGFLAEFPTVEKAVRAALAMQDAFAALFAAMPAEHRIAFRIGINVGDIIVDAEDIYGAGVNVAARLEGLADPGGICISGSAHDAVKHKIAAHYESMGPQLVKNVAAPIDVWRVQLAPPGQSRPPRQVRSAVGRPRRGPALAWAAAAVAAVAAVVATLAIGKYSLDGGETVDAERAAAISQKSVAVLPFADLSADADQAWLADGLTEELLNSLAQLRELRVPARTSSFAFKGQERDIGEIAKVLQVAYVVEGSVRRVGDDLRVTCQLIRAADGYHLWSQEYDRTATDLLIVERDIAERVAAALDVVLDDGRRETMFRSGTNNVEAFESYRKGIDVFWAVHRFEVAQTLWAANDYFERALALDPDYTAAAMGQVDAFAHQLTGGPRGYVANSPYTQAEALAHLHENLDLAIAKSPNRGMQLAANLTREFFGSTWYRIPNLIEQLRKEWDTNRVNVEVAGYLKPILMLTENYDLLREIARQQLAIDPLSPSSWDALADVELATGDLESARKVVAEARGAIGDNPGLRNIEFRADSRVGRFEKLIQQLSAAPNPERDPFLAAMKGDRDTAFRLADEIEGRTQWPEIGLLAVYFELGATDRTRNLVRRVDEIPAGSVVLADILMRFGGRVFELEDTPNFLAKLRQAGIDPAGFAPLARKLAPPKPTISE